MLGTVTLRIPGRHYVVDALAALVAGLELGHDVAALSTGLEAFTGSGRRMGQRENGLIDQSVMHDHLGAAFQPHLVSRTREFGAAMGRALGVADEVVVLDVYVAREEPDPAVTGALVADAVPLPADLVAFVPGLEEAAAELVARARPGDLVLTLGAGTVTAVGPRVLELLAAR